jgi:hypothetical protein
MHASIQEIHPFPEPQHIVKFISAIIGSEELLRQRLEKLRLFFGTVNGQAGETTKAGLLKMVQNADEIIEEDADEVSIP